MTTAKPKLLTADDLLRLDSQGVRGELIRGVLHETMPAGMKHGRSSNRSATVRMLWMPTYEPGRISAASSAPTPACILETKP